MHAPNLFAGFFLGNRVKVSNRSKIFQFKRARKPNWVFAYAKVMQLYVTPEGKTEYQIVMDIT